MSNKIEIRATKPTRTGEEVPRCQSVLHRYNQQYSVRATVPEDGPQWCWSHAKHGPRTEPRTVQATVAVSTGVYERVRALAKARGVTVREMVDELLEAALR